MLLVATAHIDKRPEAPFAFPDPLSGVGDPRVLPSHDHTPWPRLLLSGLAGRPADDRHFVIDGAGRGVG